ncbi:hypothetical protein KYK30_30120 [Shinella yambaruensis]|uniref:Uncharacterized protein n=1 Tax=Shinella yambaruensis TaxID=415996 RepID=A0ABQ5ZDX0_9HYPH|nr:hypothetical protein [Shinella yambaruensis]MCJ8028729.1 hypothetical protein [Shinella yambaruensis]MCU7983978.1 hypothetical protein [Shinella yambaruensis]GLR49902.1 hypothetical protein GCM10007923_11070 [Shinella yambaruensis]
MRKTITFSSLSKYYFMHGLDIDFRTSKKVPFSELILNSGVEIYDEPPEREWTDTVREFGDGLGYTIEGEIVVHYKVEKVTIYGEARYIRTQTADINLSKIDKLIPAPFTASNTEWRIEFNGLVSYKSLLGKTVGDLIEDNDTVNGTGNADILKMTNHSEIVRGNRGNDIIHGRGGDDILFGNTGNDTLNGGVGDDQLNGGLGADKLTGGRGADTFIFTKISDSKVNSAASDIITDFRRSQGDKIDLKTIDANTKSGGDQAFKFIGSDAFHKKAGELRFEKSSGDTVVHGDVDGDGKADFSIELDQALTLKASDFIL